MISTPDYSPKKGTLIYELIAVDNLPETSMNKTATKREILERWGRNNLLVEQVLQEQTTFTEEFDTKVGEYTHGTLWRGYLLPEGLKEQVRDLEWCVGTIVDDEEGAMRRSLDSPPLTDDAFSSMIENPFVGGVGVGGITAGAAYLIGRAAYSVRRSNTTPLFDRRTALIAGGIIGLIGASTGAGASLDYQTRLESLHGHAKQLDQYYQLAYHNVQPVSIPKEEPDTVKALLVAGGTAALLTGGFVAALKAIHKMRLRAAGEEKENPR